MISVNAHLLEYCTRRVVIHKNSGHDIGLSVAEYKTSCPWAGKLVCGRLGMFRGFPGGSDSKESTCNAGELGSIPGLGRSLEEGIATHSSVLAGRIPMDRGAWWATVHGVTKGQTRLSTAQNRLQARFGPRATAC